MVENLGNALDNQDKYNKNSINQPIENTKITMDLINSEIVSISEYFQNNSLKKEDAILKELLNQIPSIDFREYSKVKENKTIQKKHYIVSCIEVLIDLSKEYNWNLCRKNESIFLFNGNYWQEIDTDKFKDFLKDVALKMGVDKFDAKYHQFKDELYKQFITDGNLSEIQSKNQTTLINLLNGTFEITPKLRNLKEFDHRDFLTYQLPFEYNEESACPLFNNFLDEVIPEKELQLILAEYLGYIFIKNDTLKLEKVLLLYGTGANGKSVLFDIITALIGSHNITNYSLQSLTDQNGYQRAMIGNKLLNYASEINGKLESSIFKQLCSGEPVEARLPYKTPMIIKNYARFMFNCNELPKETENTHAFFRRFLIIPFKNTIPPEKQDKDLAKKIIELELTGIFNWVLVGVERLLKNKSFTESDIVKQEVLNYQKESDSVAMFIDDLMYKPSVEYNEALSTLFEEYKIYCRDNGYIHCSIKTFKKRLASMKFKFHRKNTGQIIYIEKKNLM